MPTVTFLGPFFERRKRHSMGMWIRGETVEVQQDWLDEWRHSLPESHFKISEEITSEDAGNDGIPDIKWSRKDILSWMNDNDVSTGSGYLTKTAALKLVEESLSGVADSTDNTGVEE